MERIGDFPSPNIKPTTNIQPDNVVDQAIKVTMIPKVHKVHEDPIFKVPVVPRKRKEKKVMKIETNEDKVKMKSEHIRDEEEDQIHIEDEKMKKVVNIEDIEDNRKLMPLPKSAYSVLMNGARNRLLRKKIGRGKITKNRTRVGKDIVGRGCTQSSITEYLRETQQGDISINKRPPVNTCQISGEMESNWEDNLVNGNLTPMVNSEQFMGLNSTNPDGNLEICDMISSVNFDQQSGRQSDNIHPTEEETQGDRFNY